jgi:hypothetical protein
MEAKKSGRRGGAVKIMILRMWAAGAVCFFAAWGRRGAEEADNAYSLDLIAGLILIMVLCDWIILNPVIRLAFNKKQEPREAKKAGPVLWGSLLHIARITAALILVIETYYLLNTIFIRALDLDGKAVPVPLEPILFGILYGAYFTLIGFLGRIRLPQRNPPQKERA